MIDATTPFRRLGTVPVSAWRAMRDRLGSPLTDADLAACRDAAGPHAALALAHAVKETQLGRTAPARHNLLGLMNANGSRFLDYAFWAECVEAWRDRIDDPGYKAGVYMPTDMPLLAYVATYVGGPGCWSSRGQTCANGETWDGGTGGSVGLYLAQTIDRINEWQRAVAPPETEVTPVVQFGNVPRPQWQERLIPDAQNRAWEAIGPRTVRGVVYHRMVGTLWGTDSWFRMIPGGGTAGLTDFGIDHNTGETLRWNDHTGKAHPGISANRSGWASGPWENPPGDGRAFVAKHGVAAINRDLVSIEIAGQYDSPLAPAAVERIAQLSAWLADQARVPWTAYPLNPATGLTFTYTHSEFQGHKPCPGAVVLGKLDEITARTKAILKAAQEVSAPVPPPAPVGPTGPQGPTGATGPVVPPPPAPAWTGKPAWLDADLIPWLFPEAQPGGVRTTAWLRYCGEVSRAPARTAFVFKGEPRELIVFADGTMIDLRGRVLGR